MLLRHARDLKFIDSPRFVRKSKYIEAIERMIHILTNQDSVLAIFQVGGFSEPGISDIDLFVVFKDEIPCSIDPLCSLSLDDRYLFKHALFGCSQKFFQQIEMFTFFGSYKILWKKSDIEIPTFSYLKGEKNKILKQQIAFEYLVKMYVTLVLQKTYGVASIRNLLLHVKAVLYDLDFLKVKSGTLFDTVMTLLTWRKNWFEEHPNEDSLSKWFDTFLAELELFLTAELKTQPLFIPMQAKFMLARNIILKQDIEFGFKRKGIVLPKWFIKQSPVIYRLQNRFCYFSFNVPIHDKAMPDVVLNRYNFISTVKHYNANWLPHFIPTAYGLNIFH